jgi:4-hydroxy-2-oxoheptanedioate aldolase
MDMGLKHKLETTQDRLTMHICTIPSAVVTQAIAASGADCVIIDLEHGAIDYAAAHAMIATTQGTDCTPIVRIAAHGEHHVKRALDLGAQGIMFPLIETAVQARAAVASLRYPPNGSRSFGPFLAQSYQGTNLLDYPQAVDGSLFCCLLAETVTAVENIQEICAVPGIDMIVPAQFDLSTSLGIPGDFANPLFQDAVKTIEDAANAANIPLANAALAKPQADALFARGYRAIAGFDVLWLKARAEEAQDWCKA